MSYRLNKTNGDLLTDLVDGQIDTATTDLTLVGRNYSGFGEFLNENYIKLLENFSNTSAPNNPLTGQLWFDTSEKRLKLYDGTAFKSAGGPIVSAQRPTNPVAGDLWIDDTNNQLYFWDGNDFTLAGPEYTSSQGKTGFEVETIIDSVSAEKKILKLYIAGTLVGVFADANFKVNFNRAVAGYPQDPTDTASPKRQTFEKGFNPVLKDEFLFRGTADASKALVDTDGITELSATNFMRTDQNTATSGSVRIKNSSGLSLGVGDTEYAVLKIDPSSLQTIIETQQTTRDLNVRVRVGNSFVSAIYIDSSEENIGIFNDSPTETLDVDGNGKFSGNLTVEGNVTINGTQTTLNTQTLEVEDKNIELARSNDAPVGNDITVDGGGVTLLSTNYNKEWKWVNATDSWTSNQNINMVTDNIATPAIKVDGVDILNATTLGTSVTSANGLTSIGTLTSLDVDNINLDGTTITTTTAGLNITSADVITINTKRVTGIDTPVTDADAANKVYVDSELQNENVAFNLDITGLTSPAPAGTNDGPTTDVLNILETMYPATTKNGAIATVHCTSYTDITVTIAQADLTSILDKSYLSVMTEDSSADSVVQDVTFSGDLSANTTLTPNRYTMKFSSNGTTWSHTSTVGYP